MPGKSPCIFLNDNIVYHSSQRGVARYFRRVTDGIIARFGGKTLVCSPEARSYGAARFIRSIRFRGSVRLGFHDKWASAIALVERPAVLFSAYYGSATSGAKHVYTVYDMIVERFPNHFPEQDPHVRRFVLEKKRCLERASAVFAISASVARDILACYPQIDANKIFVTPLGVDSYFFRTARGPQSSPSRPFFLYVGNRALYKNFVRLLTAFGRSGLAREFDLRVISPGDGEFSPQEAALIDTYHLEHSVWLDSVASETDLVENYARSVALVYPSECEGFGLPILEAMASGTLVATSNTCSMPEVGADIAFYFDPYDAESLADCLTRVVNLSSEERNDRVSRGNARAQTFTWERCQQQTVGVLERLLA